MIDINVYESFSFFVILGEKKCKTELDFIHREVSD